jgi:LacI family transcriptional regulator
MAVNFISMRQLAKLAGVSPATASRVFSNPQSVSEKTMKRVSTLANELGFTPNQVAKAAFGKSTKSIGIVIPESVSYSQKLGHSMVETLMAKDYLPIVLPQLKFPETVLTRLLRHQVDALIIGVSDEQIDISDLCRKQMSRIPIVAIETPRPGLWCDTVVNDDFLGGKLAAEHLLQLGHKAFGFIGFGSDKSNCVQRRQGFEQTLAAAGYELDPQNIAMLGWEGNEDQVLEVDLVEILARPASPTAFFAATDRLALSLYQSAEQCHLSIPEDISVIGFGDLDFGRNIVPKLSTIKQHPEQLGKIAANFALKRLQEPNRAPQEVKIPVELLLRQSTQTPK